MSGLTHNIENSLLYVYVIHGIPVSQYMLSDHEHCVQQPIILLESVNIFI